jgi:uncharacterized protein (DUF433 family)
MRRSIVLGIAGGALALALAGGAVLASPAGKANVAAALAQPTAQPGAPRAPAPAARRAAAGLALMLGRATADVTGLKPKDVLAELRAGKSLAQIAQAHGKTADDVIAAARTKLADRLSQAVANNRLTQARADAMLAGFDQNAPQVINDTTLGQKATQRFKQRAARNHPVAAGLVKATAEVAGLQPKDVLAELRAGKSLAQIAQAHGKTADDILAKARELGEARLDKALDRAKELIDQPGLGRGANSAAPSP